MAMVLKVSQDQALGRFSSKFPGAGRGHGAGVDGIEIAPRGQDIETATGWGARGTRRDEFAIQRIEKGLHLVRAGRGQTRLYEPVHRIEHSARSGPLL